MAFWTTSKPQPPEPIATLDAATFKSELDHAYTRGRLAESTRRSGWGVVAVLLTALAAIAVLLMALAVKQGSFAAGGAVVDGLVARATGLVAPAAPAPAPAPSGSARTG